MSHDQIFLLQGCVMITSAADIFSPLCVSTGIPLPSSSTLIVLSLFMVIDIFYSGKELRRWRYRLLKYHMVKPRAVISVTNVHSSLFLTAHSPLSTLIDSAPRIGCFF